MEHAEHRSRAVFARPAIASPHLRLRARISNRQFLVRLENAATPREQTPEANSNRHFWEGGRLEVVSGGLYRCTYNARHYMMYW
jgi:hypothetical protein